MHLPNAKMQMSWLRPSPRPYFLVLVMELVSTQTQCSFGLGLDFDSNEYNTVFSFLMLVPCCFSNAALQNVQNQAEGYSGEFEDHIGQQQ